MFTIEPICGAPATMASVTGDRSDAVRVSVVIPTYNAASLLPQQLEALAAQSTTEPFEVLVADNGSTDDLAAVVEHWRTRTPYALRRVDASGRQGVAHARNTGVAASDAEIVLVCDADDAVHEGWVDGHLAVLASADLSGGYLDIAPLNPGPERWWRGQTPLTEDWTLPVDSGFLPYATGANFGAHRTVIESLGGWDEDMDGQGGEDLEFSWRAQLRGFTLAAAPGAVVSYRLRRGLRATARQQYRYAASCQHLWERFAADGYRPPPLSQPLTELWGSLLHVHHLVRGELPRGWWVLHAAFSCGTLVAIVRYRLGRRRRTR